MSILEKLVDELPKQSFINVYRRNLLQESKTKKAIHFKFVENDTALSSVFSYEGQFLRIEVCPEKKSVKDVSIVEYVPVTQMSWVETSELKHWSTQPTVYEHYKGGRYRVLSESVHSETGERLTNYIRVDCPKKQVWSRPSEMFHDFLADGTKRFKLVREALVKK